MAGTAVLGRLSWRLAEVAAIHDETSEVKSLTFEVPDWSGHRAGQHVDVRLTAEDGYQAQRSYSIASPPEDPRLVLTVERVEDGEISPFLLDVLRVGDKLEMRGPIGGYFTWDAGDGGPLQLVAGGSGIAPLMAMIRHRVAAGSDVPVRLLYTSRSFDDVIYRDELARLTESDPSVHVIHTLTRSHPPDWRGYRRRIDAAMLEEVFGPPAPNSEIFVCGPTRMVEQVATDLFALGYASDRIKTERFGPTGG
jgi:ferredoxin-NADP reductase